MKTIVVLTGSPRRGGNSDTLSDAFIKGARSVGHTVHKFETAFMKINGCSGCDYCVKSGNACTIRDDFDEIATTLEKADVIVFASPLYWLGVSAQLKAAWDRLHAFTRPPRRNILHIKESVFLLTGHSMENIYDVPIAAYTGSIKFMGWTDRGVIIAKGVQEKSDIKEHSALSDAERLGSSL